MSGRGGGTGRNRPWRPWLEVEDLESQLLTCCLLPVERPLEELAFHVLSVQAPASRGVLVPGSGPEEFEAWSKPELTGVSAFGSHSWKDTHGPSSGRVNTGSILDGVQHATKGLVQIPNQMYGVTLMEVQGVQSGSVGSLNPMINSSSTPLP